MHGQILRRVREWFATGETPVLLTAIAVAIPGAYFGQHLLGAEHVVGFLLLMLLGVGVPTLYEQWPRRYGSARAVGWTLAAAAVLGGTFATLFLLARSIVGPFPAAVLAFLVADLGPLAAVAARD